MTLTPLRWRPLAKCLHPRWLRFLEQCCVPSPGERSSCTGAHLMLTQHQEVFSQASNPLLGLGYGRKGKWKISHSCVLLSWLTTYMILGVGVHKKNRVPTQYINTYMWDLEKLHRLSYLQSRSRDTDIKNKYMDTEGGKGVEKNLEVDIDIYTPLILCIK